VRQVAALRERVEPAPPLATTACFGLVTPSRRTTPPALDRVREPMNEPIVDGAAGKRLARRRAEDHAAAARRAARRHSCRRPWCACTIQAGAMRAASGTVWPGLLTARSGRSPPIRPVVRARAGFRR
jgi:hypothetical protein